VKEIEEEKKKINLKILIRKTDIKREKSERTEGDM
jgi:hypothetical protein